MKSNPPPHRVLFVENGIGYGGAAICMRHLARNLDRSRFTPYVVTGRTGPQYQEIAEDAAWTSIPDRRINIVGMKEALEKMRWPDRIPGSRFVLNQILARLDDVGNFLPFFIRLLWFTHRNRIELVHANNEPLCNRAALLVARMLKIPSVCHVRGVPAGSAMMSWAYRLPTHFIPVSHWISNGMQKLGVPASKRTVTYDGIPLEQLDTKADGDAFRRKFNIPDTAFTIGLVGLLIPWKGQELFLDAGKRLAAEIPNLHLLFIGGTPEDCVDYAHALHQRVEKENLVHCVTFTDHISDMPMVYNGLDIVVSASTSPEPLGTVVIEAMAMGRPLVAPDHGGAAEMAEDGKTALLFEPGNADSLSEVLLRCYKQPRLAEKLGKAARKKALKTFSVQRHTNEVQAIYDILLGLAPEVN